MAQDNRNYKSEKSVRPDQPEETAKSDQSKYGDHPFLGDDRQSLRKELLRFPERTKADPMMPFPADPARKASRDAYESSPHDESIDYLPPNPMMVIPPANLTMKLAATLVALVLFVLVIGLMFYNWMSPSARHPGQQKQGQGLEQKVP